MKNEKAKNINIELDEKTAQGQYSNLVVVNHSPTEFVLDFVNIMPGSPKAKVCSRLISVSYTHLTLPTNREV